MRIHVQSTDADPNGCITPEQFETAFGRVHGHEVSFGVRECDYRHAAPEVELLLVATRALRDILPLQAPRLRIVSVTSAGVDMLMPLDWLPDGVALLNNSGTHAAKASEYCLMALLMVANRMAELVEAQQRSDWHPVRVASLRGRRLLIVGLGEIGGATATLARCMGMQVTGVRRRAATHPDCETVVGLADLDAVLPAADYVVLALPGGEATYHLLDDRRLGLLAAGCGLVNVGRGNAIDEAALYQHLASGRLGGAVLDVFEAEPLSASSPLWRAPRLIITPHLSADDPATYHSHTLRILADNLRAHERGTPMPNQIDPATGLRLREGGPRGWT